MACLLFKLALAFLPLAKAPRHCQQYGEPEIICEKTSGYQGDHCGRCIQPNTPADLKVCVNPAQIPIGEWNGGKQCAKLPHYRICWNDAGSPLLWNEIDPKVCDTYQEITVTDVRAKTSQPITKYIQVYTGVKNIIQDETVLYEHIKGLNWFGIARPNYCSTVQISGPNTMTVEHGLNQYQATISTNTDTLLLGTYEMKCTCYFGQNTNNKQEKNFFVNVVDACGDITSTAPSNQPFEFLVLTGKQYLNLLHSDFFIPGTITCEPHHCEIIEESTNSLVTGGFFVVSSGTYSYPNVQLEIDTALLHPLANYKLKCIANTVYELPQPILYSLSFQMRVYSPNCWDPGMLSFTAPTQLTQNLAVQNINPATIFDVFLTKDQTYAQFCSLTFQLTDIGGIAYTGQSSISASGVITIDQSVESIETSEVRVLINGNAPSVPPYNFASPLFTFTKTVKCLPHFTINLPSNPTYYLSVQPSGSPLEILPLGTYLSSNENILCGLEFLLANSDGTPYTGSDSINPNSGEVTFDSTVGAAAYQAQIRVKINGNEPIIIHGITNPLFTYTRTVSCTMDNVEFTAPLQTSFTFEVLSNIAEGRTTLFASNSYQRFKIILFHNIFHLNSYLKPKFLSTCQLQFELKYVNNQPYTGTNDAISLSDGQITFDQTVESSEIIEVNAYLNGESIQGLPLPLFTYSRTVSCGPSSFVVVRPVENPNPLSPQTRVIDAVSIPFFEFDAYSQSNLNCPIESYSIYEDTTAQTTPLGFEQPIISSGVVKYSIISAWAKIQFNYKFSIRVNARGGGYAWVQSASDPQLLLEVKCGTVSSNLIDEGWYPASFGSVQYVDTSTSKSWFLLPIYTTTTGDCGVNSRQAFESNDIEYPPHNQVGYVLNNALEEAPGTMRWVIKPYNQDIHSVYQFYVKIIYNSNANYVYSPQFTLVVGCVPGYVSLTNPSFIQTETTKVIGYVQNNEIVYSFQEKTSSLSYCPVTDYEILNSNLTPFSDSNLAFACSNPCTLIKITQSSIPFMKSFVIRTRLRNNILIDSQVISFSLICTAASQQLTNNIDTFSFIFTQYDGDAKFTFRPHSLTNSGCGTTINYFISLSQTIPVVQDAGAIIKSMFFNPVTNLIEVMVDNTNLIPWTSIYIHANNSLGAYAYPQEIKIYVQYNCLFDRLIVNENTLAKDEVNRIANGLLFDSERQLLLFENTVNNFTQFVMNITNIVVNNASEFCPIQSFEVSQVQKGTFPIYQDEWENLFQVDSDSLFRLLKNDWAFGPYLIYIKAFNGVSTLINHQTALIELNIHPQPWVEPNYAPLFVTIPNDYALNIQEFKDQQKFDFVLPPIRDLNLNDTVTITINLSKTPHFMKFIAENKTIAIEIQKIQQDEIRPYPIEIILNDNKGGLTEYQFIIDIINKTQEVKMVKTTLQQANFSAQNITFEQKEEFEKEESGTKVTAYIKQISNRGQVSIVFNYTMSSSFNYTLLNSSFVDIYIEPAEKRHIYSEDFNISSLNFTWTLVSIIDKIMTIQLKFNDPSAISPLVVQDKLVFHIKEPAFFFFSPEVKKNLDPKFYTLKKSIRKQMIESHLSDLYMSNLDQGETSLESILLTSILLGLFTSLALSSLAFYLRSLQMIIHLPLLHIILPPNVSVLFNKLIGMVTFDLFSSQWTTEYVLDFDYETHRENENLIFDQLRDLGYETHNAIFNLGSLFLYFAAYILLLFLWITFKLVEKLFKKQIRTTKSLKHMLFFGFIISLFLEAYFEWLISGIFQLRFKLYTKDGETLGVFVGIMGLVFTLVVFPLLFIRFLRFPLRYFEKESFKKKWNNMFIGVNNHSKGAIAYFLVYMIRRAHFVAIAFFAEDYPGIQIMPIMFSNILIAIYINQYTPLTDKYERFLENINEFTISIVTFHELFFTDWVSDSKVQLMYGWSMIAIILLNMLINILVVMMQLIRSFRFIYIKAKLQCKRFQTKPKPLQKLPAKIQALQVEKEQEPELIDETPFKMIVGNLKQTAKKLELEAIQANPQKYEAHLKIIQNFNLTPTFNEPQQSRNRNLDRPPIIFKKTQTNHKKVKPQVIKHAVVFENPFNPQMEKEINSRGGLINYQRPEKVNEDDNEFSFIMQ